MPCRKKKRDLRKERARLSDTPDATSDPIPSTSSTRIAQSLEDPVDVLGAVFQPAAPASSSFALRPGFGELGKKINLICNCFGIVVPDGFVYHYDVEIQRKKQTEDIATSTSDSEKKYRCIGTKRNRLILNTLIMSHKNFTNSYPAYDGRKNLYTRTSLKSVPFMEEVLLEEGDASPYKSEIFVVSVKPVMKKVMRSDKLNCAISLDSIRGFYEGKVYDIPEEAIMALETILRHTPCLRLTPIGKCFFSPPEGYRCPIGEGQEIWFGHHQSVRIGQWGPFVNLDISATAFHEAIPVIDYVCKSLGWEKDKFVRRPALFDSDVILMAKKLKKLKIKNIQTRHNFTVINVTKESARALKFPFKVKGETQEVSVFEYYKLRYKKQLDYPHLPCILVKTKPNVHLPIELCHIVEGQHFKKSLSAEQRKEMIKFTVSPPNERFDKISKIREKNFDTDPTCNAFGIKVSTQPVKVIGRELTRPSITYAQGKDITPNKGSWDMRGSEFLVSATLKRWVIITFGRYCSLPTLKKFANMIIQIARERGLTVDQPMNIENFPETGFNLEGKLKEKKEKEHVELALIVVPRENKELYGQVKRIADTLLGMVTQCVKHDNVNKCSPSLVRNLTLKINTKLGGKNNAFKIIDLPLLEKPIMIMGADVSHPSATEKMPSIASVVGNIDAFPSRYAIAFRGQLHKNPNKIAVEVIEDLKSMVIELLMKFYEKTNGMKPEKIIFYRDGVSDGQYAEVQRQEVSAIRQACRYFADYEPGITYIIVQKRHHIRFRQDRKELTGPAANPPAGTTVDTIVTHPRNHDFFLQSHFSPLGTARPAHYTVLVDDNKFSADLLQKLTYKLCFIYAPCTKSISVPTPVMYAHRSAYRAREWILSQTGIESASSESDYSGKKECELLNTFKAAYTIIDPMYFV